MAFFSNSDNNLDVHAEIAALRKEIAALSKNASKQGAAAWRTTSERTSELGNELMDRAAASLPVIRRHAHDLEESIRHNPGRSIAIAGLATLAIAALCMLNNKRS